MKRYALILISIVLAASAIAQDGAPAAAPAAVPPPPAVRFVAVDVTIDSGDKPLAAYQFEFTAETADVKIVGVEGGAHPAFKDPPYYDPAALSQGRIVIAAFNTGTNLPNGKTRVATLHLQIRGDARPEWIVKIEAAATIDGERISVSASVQTR